MKGLLTTYRVLAFVVGILLAFGSLVVLPMKYLLTEGSTLQQFGEDASIVWLLHGWIFAVYVIVTFFLARKAGWSISFTLLALVAGLIPLLIFWVEHRVVQKLRAENPDLAPVAHSGGVTTAFVLGGGGVLGAVEVGMLRALFEREIRPDLVLGTSIGAFNGALVASQPDLAVVEKLTELWQSMSSAREAGYGDRTLRTVRRAVASGTHLWSAEPLRQRLVEQLGDLTFEELPVTFQVCAASIERSAEHWFTSGRVVDAVVASAAVPGLLPPAVVDGEHYLDGGIVNSVPLGRAVALGATRVFVLQVGRLDRPLTPPRRPWEVARVSFEIARRHRFVRELAELPDSVECHVLPARGTSARDDTLLGSRDFSGVQARIDATYDASRAYLDENT